MISDPAAARCGVLVQYAMDMHDAAPTVLTPPPDPRLSPDWRLVGYLTAQDAVFRRGDTLVGAETVCYGYLAQSTSNPLSYIAVVRGTDGIVEWVEDAQFLSIQHPVAGRVESGFYSIYSTMRYVQTPLAFAPQPAVAGISDAIGEGNVTVIGHSLGSALATYLAFDLARHLGSDRVTACLLASPRPGNGDFVHTFDAIVPSYKLLNYELDLVPRVPVGPDYTDLPQAVWIGISAAQARIRFDLMCHHHVLCYCAMLDYTLMDWAGVAPPDRPLTMCIRGPAGVSITTPMTSNEQRAGS